MPIISPVPFSNSQPLVTHLPRLECNLQREEFLEAHEGSASGPANLFPITFPFLFP